MLDVSWLLLGSGASIQITSAAGFQPFKPTGVGLDQFHDQLAQRDDEPLFLLAAHRPRPGRQQP
jgi:hypothetical protein